jgi:hypothetical protein
MHKWLLLIIIVIGLVALSACDSLIPEDYRDKNYKMDELDATACLKLSRPLYTRDSNNVIVDTNFVALQLPRYDLLFDSAALNTNSEGQNIAANYLSILNGLTLIEPDTMMNASFLWDPNNDDAKPVFFAAIDAVPGRYVFYISWQLSEFNKEAFVDVNLVNIDSTFLKKKTQINLASTECFENTSSSQGDKFVLPKLRGRFELEIQTKTLVRFEMPNPLAFKQKSSNAYDTFHVLVLRAE